MPRVENCGPEVDAFCEQSGNGSSTHDVCMKCHGLLELDPNRFNRKLTPYNGDPQGSEGWSGDIEHPAYDGEDYRCEVCNKKLTARDDGECGY